MSTDNLIPGGSAQLPRSGTAFDRETLSSRITELGDWFHNIDLHGINTAPDHFLGDFPNVKWKHLKGILPPDLSGASVLDVGCNAGFYSIEMKKRGASRVLGIDVGDRYLDQARFAAATLGLEIEFEKRSVYSVDELAGQFDIVLFMGLFYHLRYPLLALDKLVKKISPTTGQLIFQTMLRGSETSRPWKENYQFWDKQIFKEPDFPCAYFIEHQYSDDQTNWFIPNAAGAEAMLRSAGLEIVAHPEVEIWVAKPKDLLRNGSYILDAELDGTL